MFERIDARYDDTDDELPCCCVPGRPCGVHWSRMDDVQRREIAHQLGVRTTPEAIGTRWRS
jgi:hypothetical protein